VQRDFPGRFAGGGLDHERADFTPISNSPSIAVPWPIACGASSGWIATVAPVRSRIALAAREWLRFVSSIPSRHARALDLGEVVAGYDRIDAEVPFVVNGRDSH
jgi:hypothetical protein